MITFGVLILAFAMWLFVGCVVLALVDKDNELYLWMKSGPSVAWIITVGLWPFFVYRYTKRR